MHICFTYRTRDGEEYRSRSFCGALDVLAAERPACIDANADKFDASASDCDKCKAVAEREREVWAAPLGIELTDRCIERAAWHVAAALKRSMRFGSYAARGPYAACCEVIKPEGRLLGIRVDLHAANSELRCAVWDGEQMPAFLSGT